MHQMLFTFDWPLLVEVVAVVYRDCGVLNLFQRAVFLGSLVQADLQLVAERQFMTPHPCPYTHMGVAPPEQTSAA